MTRMLLPEIIASKILPENVVLLYSGNSIVYHDLNTGKQHILTQKQIDELVENIKKTFERKDP